MDVDLQRHARLENYEYGLICCVMEGMTNGIIRWLGILKKSSKAARTMVS